MGWGNIADIVRQNELMRQVESDDALLSLLYITSNGPLGHAH